MFKPKPHNKKPHAESFSASIIGAGNVITGNIEAEGDIRIDGTVKGNVSSMAKILIGPDGLVEGNIFCREADINGQVCGNINTKELLHLKGNAAISGDIHTAKLFIEPTVSFNGQCHMGANIVELKPEMGIVVNE
ncbi:MAG: polymer-forming cytoskeletal protein [Chitinophagaceae bacterium]|nr:MAG: polymer-forming cytoskeletal protein [Chitinophagaceae bacterium]